ncbi:MAG: hypothetical protein IE923_03150 [Micrococcales bacterium]|nr:hypothetical protein [Micrococcales bacterium]
MSVYVAADLLSDAWLESLRTVNDEHDGTATHLMTVVRRPQDGDDADARTAVDRALSSRSKQGVSTVANTLFPVALYNDPGLEWSPDLTRDDAQALDQAAHDLYQAYLEALPTLKRVPANRGGTYFSRMVSWPGKTAGGVNQLDRRIEALRGEHRSGRRTFNASDIAVAGDADGANDPVDGGLLEEYLVSDTRRRGFPCLVHIDISVRDGSLAVLGVYRHWHLITRGYGNLVGLMRLQRFLCQQTGYIAGELAVVAGHANAERTDYSGRSGVEAIVEQVSLARANSTAQRAESA